MHSTIVYRQKIIQNVHLSYMNAKDIDILVGKNVRRLRKRTGLTQDQLGEKIGVDGNVIAQIEGAIRGMGKSIMARLCSAMKVHPWEFYIDQDTPITADASERSVVETLRSARPLGVAEDFVKYGRFLVEDAKRMRREKPKKK